MRVLIKLKSNTTQVYQNNYFHKFQGFVYNLLKGTEHEILHDKKGYKFFCFSNLFPLYEKNGEIPPIEDGGIRNFIVSSPSRIFIKTISKKLKDLEEIHIGDYSFSVEKFSEIIPVFKSNLRIISASPIIIRIPEMRYDEYFISEKARMKGYIYWRPEIDFRVFVKQLEENLFKKYNEFYKTELKEFPIFEQFRFKKQCVNTLTIDGADTKILGSIWEFSFSYLSKEQRKILEFGIDCGFGERNTYGFGFVNIVR